MFKWRKICYTNSNVERRLLMTPNKEDYIKTIYKLGGKGDYVSNKAINQQLNLSAASTTEMLNKLVIDGTVDYIRYKGAKLTQKGINVAERLIRTHKLWEVFLVNSLGFEPDEVHSQAEILEHSSTVEMTERLAIFLGNPTHCPHGEEIPPFRK